MPFSQLVLPVSVPYQHLQSEEHRLALTYLLEHFPI